MTWVKLALALVQIGLSIYRSVREDVLRQQGAEREKLKELQTMETLHLTLQKVETDSNTLTDDQVKQELDKRGDFRD